MKIAYTRLLKSIILVVCAGMWCMLSSSANQQNSLAKQLIGEWRNQYLKIVIHTAGNNDSTLVIEADSTNWEAKLKIKPIRTFFKADGSYRSEYHNLQDSIIRRTSGTWQIKNDSLTMRQTLPAKETYTLRLSIKKDIATFEGVIDVNNDGKVNDPYLGIQKRYIH